LNARNLLVDIFKSETMEAARRRTGL